MVNESESEAIGLCIAAEAISDMANHALFDLLALEDSPGEAQVTFRTRQHQQLFLVRLLDFVKEDGSRSLTGVKGSCLEVVRSAGRTRAFDVSGSVEPLERAAEDFHRWLVTETPLCLWLPSLDINARLLVERQELLYIAGNQGKHNLARLTAVSKRICALLQRHGYDVPIELVPLALDDFREHLQEDYFVYYGTWIVEHLVAIWWGIQDYLLPVYRQVYVPPETGDVRYSFKYPEQITNKVAQEWFWRLMNHVRTGPYFEPFVASRYLRESALRGGC